MHFSATSSTLDDIELTTQRTSEKQQKIKWLMAEMETETEDVKAMLVEFELPSSI